MQNLLWLYLSIFFLTFVLSEKLEETDILIIGAGAAGIAAATKLLKNNITNITILEAGSRIGGRIHTTKIENDYVDIGAQFCHGKVNNVVYDMVKDLDVLWPQDFFKGRPKVYYSNGELVGANLTNDILNSIINYDDDLRLTNETMEHAFLDKYNSTILKKYINDTKKMKIAIDAIKMIHYSILTEEAASNWNELAADRHSLFDGVNFLWKRKGYITFLDILTQEFPKPENRLPIEEKLHLNMRVKEIDWSGPKVIVKTENGQVWSANQVIHTPSAGVLKRNKDKFFVPSLPSEKLSVIEKIGFGGIMKIIFHFPERWWHDTGAFLFVWSEKDLADAKTEFPHGPVKDGVSWLISVAALVPVNGESHTLITWLAGDMVPEIENLTEDILEKGCMYMFQKFLGNNYNITKADKIIWSRWNNDPDFLGTYTWEKAEYFDKNVYHQDGLAKPLVGSGGELKVLFAGEATSHDHASTVHGAAESGFREADRLIDYRKKLNVK